MLRLVLILAVMIVAMAFAPAFVGEQGFVSIGIGSYVIETSVYTALIIIFLFYILLFILERLLRGIFGIPGALRRWRAGRAQKSIQQGAVDLLEGRYGQADKNLVSRVSEENRSVVSYILAAKSAARDGNTVQARKYLKSAVELNPDAELACGMMESDILLDKGLWDDCGRVLGSLEGRYGSEPVFLLRKSVLAEKLNDAGTMLNLLPVLRSKKVFPEQKLHEMTLRASMLSLDGIGEEKKVWSLMKSLPRAERSQPDVIALFAGRFVKLGCLEQADSLIVGGLKKERGSEKYLRLSEEVFRLRAALPGTLKRLRKDFPDSDSVPAEVLKAEGAILEASGERDDARIIYERILKGGQDHEVGLRLAATLANQRLFEKAVTLYRSGQAKS